jgi:hypothetical protein
MLRRINGFHITRVGHVPIWRFSGNLLADLLCYKERLAKGRSLPTKTKMDRQARKEEMNEIFNCPAVRSYKIGKAYNYLVKAHSILEDLGLLTSQMDEEFDSLLGICSELAFEERQRRKLELEQLNENRC